MSIPKISIRRPNAEQPTSDVVDLFWARQSTARPARQIKCLVCQRSDKEGSISGVCVHCASDPSSTLTWIYNLAEATRERLHETGERWEAIYTHSPAQERFDAYRASQDAAKRAKVEQMARKGMVDPLMPLILAWLDYKASEAKVYEIEAWVKRCEEALQ